MRAVVLVSVMTSVVAVAACSSQDRRIPSRDGPLVLELRYPIDGSPVGSSDSTPLWGTVGSGRGSLTVNGVRVPVEANGTFAGYVPVPAGGAPVLEFVGRLGGDSVVQRISMRRGDGGLASGVASGAAVSGAVASRAVANGERVAGSVNRVASDSGIREWGHWVVMRRLPSDTADSATQWRPIYSRWSPGGAVAIPLPQGMRMYADARAAGWARLRLSSAQWVWVPLVDVDSVRGAGVGVASAGVMGRARNGRGAVSSPSGLRLLRAGVLAVREAGESLAMSIALPERLPTTVELAGDRLYWTVYGAEWGEVLAASDVRGRLPVRRVVPSDSASGRVVVELELSEMPLGWRTEWRAGALHLVVRRIPDVATGLQGLSVVLDPGHPPDGSVGPSRLREDSVTLQVALRAAERLRGLGARVTLTRASSGPMSLEARAVVAERADAHVFVSIHLNSPGAGRPPEAVNGSMTYWMSPNARVLAGLMQEEVAESLGQLALGSRDGEYAVLRPTWMTAVLLEGAGIVIPEREAYFRTDAGIAAYADGIVRGIVRWRAAPESRRLRGWSTPSTAVVK